MWPLCLYQKLYLTTIKQRKSLSTPCHILSRWVLLCCLSFTLQTDFPLNLVSCLQHTYTDLCSNVSGNFTDLLVYVIIMGGYQAYNIYAQYKLFSFNWDSLYARLNSHYEVWSYKIMKQKDLSIELEIILERTCY